jgi:hypothetical protein
MLHRKQAVIELSIEIVALRDQVRSVDAHLAELRRRLHAREDQLDQLLSGAGADGDSPIMAPAPTETESPGDPMHGPQVGAATPSGQRMKHDTTICGEMASGLSLKRAMLYIVRRAVAAGIHPRDLRLHEGTINASTRWLVFEGHRTPEAVKAAVKNPIRWFVDEPMIAGNETWVLTSQWSWDEDYGSSFADLQRIQATFPQLGLSWHRY